MTTDAAPGRSRRLLGGFLLLAFASCVGACALFWGPSEEELGRIREVVRRDDALVLDVRSEEEYRGGHLAGAKNVPVGELAERLDVLGPKDRPLVVY